MIHVINLKKILHVIFMSRFDQFSVMFFRHVIPNFGYNLKYIYNRILFFGKRSINAC